MKNSLSRIDMSKAPWQVHSHGHAHIVIPVGSSLYLRFNDREYVLKEDELCFIPPEVIHYYNSEAACLTLNIPADMMKSSDLIYLSENCVRKIDKELQPLVFLIQAELNTNSGSTDSVKYLLYYLYEKLVQMGRLPSLTYIEENFASDITIRELAAMENYNISYYTEWFKKNVGCLPSEYLRMVRIDKAKEILATTRMKIIDVAMHVGYYNSSSFTRAFREVEGITPNQYRKQMTQIKETSDETIPATE